MPFRRSSLVHEGVARVRLPRGRGSYVIAPVRSHPPGTRGAALAIIEERGRRPCSEPAGAGPKEFLRQAVAEMLQSRHQPALLGNGLQLVNCVINLSRIDFFVFVPAQLLNEEIFKLMFFPAVL